MNNVLSFTISADVFISHYRYRKKEFTLFLSKLVKHKEEQGLSLPEIMISAVIIVILLVASATAFSNAITVTSGSASRVQASQIAQSVLAVAEQAPYKKIAVTKPNSTYPVPGECSSTPWRDTYNGVTVITQTTPYTGLEFCQVYPMTGTPGNYTTAVYVTAVNAGNYDGQSNSTGTYQKFSPKRITVVVTWTDSLRPGQSAEKITLTESIIKTPTVGDCIPPIISSTTSSTSQPPTC